MNGAWDEWGIGLKSGTRSSAEYAALNLWIGDPSMDSGAEDAGVVVDADWIRLRFDWRGDDPDAGTSAPLLDGGDFWLAGATRPSGAANQELTWRGKLLTAARAAFSTRAAFSAADVDALVGLALSPFFGFSLSA